MTILIFIVSVILITGTMIFSTYFREERNNNLLGSVLETASFVIAIWASAYFFNTQEFIFAATSIIVYVDVRVSISVMALYNKIRKELRNGEY